MPAETFIPEALFRQIGWVIVHFTWQASLIALITGIILLVLKKASGNLRYVLCCFSLMAMVCFPIITLVSNSDTAVRPLMTSSSEELSPMEKTDVYWNGRLIGTQHRSNVIAISKRDSIVNYIEANLFYVTLGWLIGFVLISTYRVIGFARLNILIKKTRSVIASNWERKIRNQITRLNIKQNIRIFESPHVTVPAVLGWVKPILLIPVSFFTGMDSKYVESIIAHELAHIKRYDYLVNVIQLIIETLGFFHPGVWWLSNRIRTEREHCCDDWAVHTVGDRLTYVKSLVRLEENSKHPRVIVAADGSDLFKRVTRILGHKTQNRSLGVHYTGFFSLSIISLVFLVGVTLFQYTGNNPDTVSAQILNENNNLAQGLVAYYPFNGNANDESGYLNHGAVNGAILTTDRFGYAESAYLFDGEDDFIEVEASDLLNIPGSLTVSCWVSPFAVNDYDAWISKANFNDTRSQWRAGFGENNNFEWGLTEFTLVDTSNIFMDYWVMGDALEFNTWSQVTIVADQENGQVKLYKNGQKVGEIGELEPFIVSNDPMYIGYLREENAYFNGMVDDVRIYNYALDDEEVFALYHFN